MNRLTAFVAVSLLLTAGEPCRAAGETAPDNLQGRWQRTTDASIRVALDDLTGEGGEVYSQFVLSLAGPKGFVIRGDKLIFRGNDREVELTLTIDPGKAPKTVVAKTGDGQVVFRGIYETGGGTLSLCISRKGFPKEFKGTSRTPLLELKQAQKE